MVIYLGPPLPTASSGAFRRNGADGQPSFLGLAPSRGHKACREKRNKIEGRKEIGKYGDKERNRTTYSPARRPAEFGDRGGQSEGIRIPQFFLLTFFEKSQARCKRRSS